MQNISVCIATYNGEKFIKKQLQSILSQLNEKDEVVISDDSSTDNTLQIIESFKDKRIKLIKGNKFSNPIFNFENAIKHAKNDYIFLSDQDDYWASNKVEIMKTYFISYDLVVSNASVINEDDEILGDSYFIMMKSGTGFWKNLFRNSYLGCCIAFHRGVLKKALPFPKDIPMHDIWLGFVAELYYKPKFITNKLTLYRRHSDNFSSASRGKSSFNLLQKIKFRYNLLKYIPKLMFR